MGQVLKLLAVFFAYLFFTTTVGFAQASLQDSIFNQANLLKAQLVEQGDTTLHLRKALGNELERVCQSVALTGDHNEFVDALYSCETLVRDLSDSYIYLGILQRTAESWNQTKAEDEAIAEVYMALVRIAARMSNHSSAHNYLNKISELPESSLNANLRTKLHFFKGYFAFFADNFEEAILHTKQAALESISSTEHRVKILAHDASAGCLNELGLHEEAISYAKKAIELQNAYLDTAQQGTAISNLYLNLAEAEYGIGRKKDAYANVEYSFELAHKSKHPIEIGNSHSIRGRLNRKDGNLSTAKKDLEIAIELFMSTGDLYSVNLVRKELILLAKQENNLAEAIKLSDEYHHLRDSLDARKHYIAARMESLDREAERNLAQQALTNEMTARQDAEKARAKFERIAWSVVVSLLMCIVGFIYYRLRLRHITQQELEAEVERRTAKITEQAKRLQASNEELERFAYIASHDLKTPLRNITSFLNLIERRLPIGAKALVNEYLEIAKTNARQMHFLITDVLEFSRIDANINAESEHFNLNSAITQLIDQLGPDLERVNGKVSLSGDLDIFAPKAYVLQAVQNLVENGLKYNDSEIPEVNVTVWKHEGFAHISVADNGIGIAPEYHDQIFTLFKRLHTTDEYEGTGLGLAVCKKVITRIGGNIEVSQGENGGTIFELKIPHSDSKDIDSRSLIHDPVEFA